MQGGERRFVRCASCAAGIFAICYAMSQAGALQLSPACTQMHTQLKRFAYNTVTLVFIRVAYGFAIRIKDGCMCWRESPLFGLKDWLYTCESYSCLQETVQPKSSRLSAIEGHDS